MSPRVLAALLVALPLAAQEGPFFEEPKAPWWKPEWELRLVGDRVRAEEYANPASSFSRTQARLRLRWTFEGPWSRLVLGTRHALGSDGNALNAPRYDQEPSNGSHLDAAHVDLFRDSEHTSSELRLGLQDNPLLSQESLWDKDLVLTGASLRAGLRREASGLVELGVRAVGGRVRSLPAGDVDLAAWQGVLRLETGPVAWTLHSGRWDVTWTAGAHRLRPLPGDPVGAEERLRFAVHGVGLQWLGPLPIELKGISHRNLETSESGSELQAWLGTRTRPWWPQLGYIHQRFERTGTPSALNGDEWWFVANARGPRVLVALPLPGRWVVQASHMRHVQIGSDLTFTRTQLTVTKRF